MLSQQTPDGKHGPALSQLSQRQFAISVCRDRAVTELTTDNAEIRWTVHLANKESAWYQFQIALDIPEAGSAAPSWLRSITITDRSRLVIDPGPRYITGRDAGGGPAYRFDTGTFLGTRVYLGELLSILAAGQPSSCRPTTDRGCKAAPFKSRSHPSTAESGGATRAALLAMRAHRGTGSASHNGCELQRGDIQLEIEMAEKLTQYKLSMSFAAIAAGRNRFVPHEIGLWRWAIGLLAYVLMLGAHAPVVGVSPLPAFA
jgi:hypothetical protein